MWRNLANKPILPKPPIPKDPLGVEALVEALEEALEEVHRRQCAFHNTFPPKSDRPHWGQIKGPLVLDCTLGVGGTTGVGAINAASRA